MGCCREPNAPTPQAGRSVVAPEWVRHSLVVPDRLVLEGRSIEKRDHLTGQCIALRGDRADRGQPLPIGDVVADDGCFGKELAACLFILHAHRRR